MEQASKLSVPGRRGRNVALGVALLALLVYAGVRVAGQPTDAPIAVTALVVTYLTCTLATVAGVRHRGRERLSWVLVGVAIACYGSSASAYAIAPSVAGRFPSLADVGLFAFYPLMIAAFAAIMHTRVSALRRVLWLDVAIGALGLGAVMIQIVRPALPDAPDSATTGQLLYVTGDVAFLGFLASVVAQLQRRLTPTLTGFGAGAALLALGDVVYLFDVVHDRPPAALSALCWPAGLLMIAWASGRPPITRPRPAAEPRGAAVVPLVAAGALLPIALFNDEHRPVLLGLAAAGLVAVVVRLSVGIAENARLTEEVRRELDELEQADRRLRDVSAERDAILEAAGDGIYRLDLHGRIDFVNPAAAAMLGYAPGELLGQDAHELLHHSRADRSPYPRSECPVHSAATGTASERIEDEVFWRRDGSSVPVSYVADALRSGGEVAGVVCVFRDETERRQMEAERDALLRRVHAMALTDGLTGLPNRRAWDEELRRELARAARLGSRLTVALLDLDRFKDYNDAHGHGAGDELLREASTRWRLALRTSDFIARYGGEEFAVVLHPDQGDDAEAALQRVREQTPYGQSFSAGLATWDGQESAEELVARADTALYEAKQAGRDRTVAAK